jgi:hypothetical protein
MARLKRVMASSLEDADDLGSAFELAVQPLQGNHPVKLSITHKCKHSKFSAYLDVR